MRVSVEWARDVTLEILTCLDLNVSQREAVVDCLIEAELSGKSSHGLSCLTYIIESIIEKEVNADSDEINVVSESDTHLFIDGNKMTGYYVFTKSIEIALSKMNDTDILAVGHTNTAPSNGMVGNFARASSESGYIFISFSNCDGGLVPHGLAQAIFGTNPVSIGLPTQGQPIILDMASTSISWGEVMLAESRNELLPENVAIDSRGNITRDPSKAMTGGLLPFSGHKGSGIALIIEILAGALTGSRVGKSIRGGWGTFYILINPSIFGESNNFFSGVNSIITELKSGRRSVGFEEVYYPGEQSLGIRKKNIDTGSIDLDDTTIAKLKSYLEMYT